MTLYIEFGTLVLMIRTTFTDSITSVALLAVHSLTNSILTLKHKITSDNTKILRS